MTEKNWLGLFGPECTFDVAQFRPQHLWAERYDPIRANIYGPHVLCTPYPAQYKVWPLVSRCIVLAHYVCPGPYLRHYIWAATFPGPKFMAHFTPASSSPLCTSGLEGGGELAVAVAAAAVAASTRGGSRLRRRSPPAPKADAV